MAKSLTIKQMAQKEQLKGFFNNLIAGAVWDGVKQLWGPAVLAGVVALWQKLKHGSLDWAGILGIFFVASVLLFLNFRKSKKPSGMAIAARDASPSKLTIHSANYAAWEGGGVAYDVTEFLRQMIKGDSLVLKIENSHFQIDGGPNFVPHDPKDYKPKRLQVTYSYEGGPSQKMIERSEHALIVLPEDSEITGENDLLKQLSKNDAANLANRIRQVNQHVEFHFHVGSDPYLDIITELWNGSIFTLVNYGEISGHGAYVGRQLAAAPRIAASVEPVLLTIKHGESVTLIVRQFLSVEVADMMWANHGRGVAIELQSISVRFKVLPVFEASPDPYTWWGPRFAIEDAKRILN